MEISSSDLLLDPISLVYTEHSEHLFASICLWFETGLNSMCGDRSPFVLTSFIPLLKCESSPDILKNIILLSSFHHIVDVHIHAVESRHFKTITCYS